MKKTIRKNVTIANTQTVSENVEIIGFLETIDPSLTAIGWAADASSDASVLITVAKGTQIIATGETTQFRPDLVRLGITDRASGFRISIPKHSINRIKNRFHVFANGVQIAGSPMEVDLSSHLQIVIMGMKGNKLHIRVDGWVGASIKGTLKADGKVIARPKISSHEGLPGSLPKVDLFVEIPKDLQDGKLHAYVFEIDHDEVVVRSDVTFHQYPDYSFHIDRAGNSGLDGWVIRKDRGSGIFLEAVYNDVVIGSGFNSIPRDDVAGTMEIKPDGNRFGFSIDFTSIPFEGAGSIYLRDADAGVNFAEISIVDNYEQAVSMAAGILNSGDPAARVARADLFSKFVAAAGSGVSTSFTDLSVRRTGEAGKNRLSIIIPVYSGAIETAECLESVFSASNETPHEIILVDDHTPDPVISNYLRSLELREISNLKIFHRSTNNGFSAAVNLGMVVAGGNDVILLNADTVVQDGWIDRIVAAADSDPSIGTVTPFSNNGEICSLPYLCKSIPIDTSNFAKEIDKIAKRVNPQRLVDIPVAIGFCMFIRRNCLNDVGYFDAEKWGRGYGEEVDFCLKASSRGWRHVLASNVFVVHRGAVSFGNEKLERIIESAKKINQQYPFYDAVIQRFLTRDPVAKARRAVNLELLANSLAKDRVLHLTHNLGGGTERYVRDLSALYSDAGFANVVMDFDKTGQCRLRFETKSASIDKFFTNIHDESYASSQLDELKAHLLELGFSKVHIHSPIGVPPAFLAWLTESFDYDATIHDYAWVCPRTNLTTSTGYFYGDDENPAASLIDAIANPMPGLLHYVKNANQDINTYRSNFAALLKGASKVIVGVKDVQNRLEKMGVEAHYLVKPHPESGDASSSNGILNSQLRPGERTRVALFGGISQIKGFSKLLDCAKYAQFNNLPLDFIVFGYTMNNTAFDGLANVRILGPYNEEDLDSLVRFHQPHISFFPNQWPETYSYTLSKALELRLWPVVTDLGAPAERVREIGFGSLLPIDFKAEQATEILLHSALHSTLHKHIAQPAKPRRRAATLLEYLSDQAEDP